MPLKDKCYSNSVTKILEFLGVYFKSNCKSQTTSPEIPNKTVYTLMPRNFG